MDKTVSCASCRKVDQPEAWVLTGTKGLYAYPRVKKKVTKR
jgi:hypothetical protein